MFQINEKLIADNRAFIALASSKVNIEKTLKDGTVIYTNDTSKLYYKIPEIQGGIRRILAEDDLLTIRDLIEKANDISAVEVNSIPNKTIVRDSNGYIYVDQLVIDNKISISYDKVENNLKVETFNDPISESNIKTNGYVASTEQYPSTVPLRDAYARAFATKFIINNKLSLSFENGMFNIQRDTELDEDYVKGIIHELEVSLPSKKECIPIRDSNGAIYCEGIVIDNRALIKYNSILDDVEFIGGLFIPNEISVANDGKTPIEEATFDTQVHTAALRDVTGAIYCNSLILGGTTQFYYNIASNELMVRPYENYTVDITNIQYGSKTAMCPPTPNTLPLRDVNGDIHTEGIIFENKYLMKLDPDTKDLVFIDISDKPGEVPSNDTGNFYAYYYSVHNSPVTIPMRDNRGYVCVNSIVLNESAKLLFNKDTMNVELVKGDFRVGNSAYEISKVQIELMEHIVLNASDNKIGHVKIKDDLNNASEDSVVSSLFINDYLEEFIIENNCSIIKSNYTDGMYRTTNYTDSNSNTRKKIQYSSEKDPLTKTITIYQQDGIAIKTIREYSLTYELHDGINKLTGENLI